MLRKLMRFLAVSLVITAVIPLGLIASQWPADRVETAAGLDFSRQVGAGGTPLPLAPVGMRDGYGLMTRHLAGPEGAPLVVLVHGSGWHGQQFDRLAPRLATRAEVLAPDLRGHGTAPGRRGDVDYIGQMEDDLADLIAAYADPGQKVVLAGHSSGGGLVVRMAGGAHADLVDAVVLLAPFLKHNAPTVRPDAGGWARPLTRRIIGLSMLNALGVHALDHLTVIQFAMPDEVLEGPLGDTATVAYSWRLNTGYAPRAGYLDDIAELPPFLLIAGAEDESMVATAYEPLMSAVTGDGSYHVIPGLSHLDVVDAPQTLALIGAFLDGL